MTKRAVFINTGFDPTIALDAVAALSLSTGDLLVLVYPLTINGPSKIRSENTITQIKAHLDLLKTRGRNIILKELSIGLADLKTSLAMLLDSIAEAKKSGLRVYLDLTGGVRAITVLMTLIAAWFPYLVDEITLVSEVNQMRISLPVIPTAVLNDWTLCAVLEIVALRGNVKRKDLCRDLGISESSISRAVTKLKNMRLLDEELRTLYLNDKFKILEPFFTRLIKYNNFQKMK